MKKYRTLTIPCTTASEAAKVVGKLVQLCKGPSFEHVYTNPTHPYPVEFILVELKGLPKAKLLFGQSWSDSSHVIVVNIVPDSEDLFQLTKVQYNAILEQFYKQIVAPLFHEAVITPEDCAIETLLPLSSSYLKHWYDMSNPGGRICHPLDVERWYEFVLQVLRNDESFSSDDLEYWLREDMHEREESINEIVERYDYDRDAMHYAITH